MLKDSWEEKKANTKTLLFGMEVYSMMNFSVLGTKV